MSYTTFLVHFLNEEYQHFAEYQTVSDHKDSATLTQTL